MKKRSHKAFGRRVAEWRASGMLIEENRCVGWRGSGCSSAGLGVGSSVKKWSQPAVLKVTDAGRKKVATLMINR